MIYLFIFIYSVSNVDVPKDVINNVKGRLFKFLWRNKPDKIKRAGVYQDHDKGGLRMLDVETMIKSLRLAWIPTRLKGGLHNWRTVPDHCFRSRGGLRFLLKCNYCVRFLDDLPKFYKDA